MTNIHLQSPTCSITYFAHVNNVSVGTVRGWIEKDYLPTTRFGKHQLINLVALSQMLSDDEEGGEERDRPDEEEAKK